MKGEVDYYSFKAEQGEEIYFSMVIPVIDRYQNFKPDVALIGPDLENDYVGCNPNYITSSLKLEADKKIIIVRDNQDNPEIFLNHLPAHLTGGGSNFQSQLQQQELIIWQSFPQQRTRVYILLPLAGKKSGD